MSRIDFNASKRGRLSALSAGWLVALLGLLPVSCDTQIDTSSASFVVSIGDQLQLLSSTGERLLTFGYGGVMPEWTPDGKSFVFVGLDGIMQQRIGAPTPRLLFSAGVFPEWPYPLSDGSVLLQICPTCDLLPAHSIAYFDASMDELRYLTDSQANDRSPTAAESRDSIYFLSNRDSSLAGSQVYRMSFDGSNPVRITSNRRASGGLKMAISRDENRLAYSDTGRIYILDLNTEQVVDSLTVPPEQYPRGSLSFSPDGDSLLVVTESSPDHVIHLLAYDLATRSYREILTSTQLISASWRPAG